MSTESQNQSTVNDDSDFAERIRQRKNRNLLLVGCAPDIYVIQLKSLASNRKNLRKCWTVRVLWISTGNLQDIYHPKLSI